MRLNQSTKFMPSIINENGPVENQKLCQSQSGGVFSVLASFCSISQASSALRNVHTLFESSPTMDDNSRIHLQQVATCFYCELVRLGKHNRNCRALAMDHVRHLLLHGLTALLDPDTLAMFPTSNLSFLSQLDGLNSRSKGNDQLSKVQIYSHAPPHDPDLDAFKIKRMGGDYFDSAGPTYACKNVWSFLMNVGHVFAVSNPYETKYPRHFQSMTAIGRYIVDICNTLHSDELDMTPQISVERECLKRLIVFQKLFALMTDGDNECLDAILGIKGSLCSVTSTIIIENLYYLSGCEIDVEDQRRIGCDDAITRYRRSKSLAFQRAYTELCSSLLSIILRQKENREGTRILDLVRNLIISAFRGGLDLRRTIEGAALNLNLRLRKKACKGRVQYMTNDLANSFFRRTSDMLVCAARGSDNFRADLFRAMFNGLPSKEAGDIDSFTSWFSSRLVLTSEAFGVKSSIAHDGLERAIDDRMLYSEVLRGIDLDGQKSILGLREWIMSNFFAALLRSQGTSPSTRLIVLKSLACFIKAFSSPDTAPRDKIYNENGNLASYTTFVKLFYSLKECLSNAIRLSTIDANFITEFYACARHCIEMPMFITATSSGTQQNTTTVLSWARASSEVGNGSNPHSIQCSAYITTISLWLNLCGILLRQPEATTCLRNFLIRINDHDSTQPYALEDIGVNTNPDMQQVCSIFNSLNKLEGELSLQMANSNRVKVSNPYAASNTKSSSGTPSSEATVPPRSVEALEAIKKYCEYFLTENH